MRVCEDAGRGGEGHGEKSWRNRKALSLRCRVALPWERVVSSEMAGKDGAAREGGTLGRGPCGWFSPL